MASVPQVLVVTFAVVVAAVLFLPIADVVGQHTGTQSVNNESVTAELDTFVELDNSNLVADSETVLWFNESSGEHEELTKDSDYEIRYESGELNVTSSSPVAEGDEVLVSYDYQATSGVTTTVITLIPLFLGVVIIATVGDYISRAVG